MLTAMDQSPGKDVRLLFGFRHNDLDPDNSERLSKMFRLRIFNLLPDYRQRLVGLVDIANANKVNCYVPRNESIVSYESCLNILWALFVSVISYRNFRLGDQ